jgi:diguanylate cyclase (GGDEF)-like protein
LKLEVTSTSSAYRLTALIVLTAGVASLALAVLLIQLMIPPELTGAHDFLVGVAVKVAPLTVLAVAGPFGLFVSFGLLKSHGISKAMERLATTDSLTGLPNRVHTIELAAASLARCLAEDRDGGLLFIDLDHFKQINDTHGHAAGDQALRHAADTMSAMLEPDMTLGRFGGEEFVCFVPDKARAEAMAAAFVAMLRAKPLRSSSGELTVTASIGLAETAPSTSLDELLRRADEALYAAKAQGRNRVVNHAHLGVMAAINGLRREAKHARAA